MTPDQAFDALLKAYKGQRSVTSGKMFASHGLKVNGKIFSMLYKGGLVVKLPAARADEIVSSHTGEYFKLGKRVMKEWVVIHTPPGAGWLRFAEEAKQFVGGSKTKG